MKKQLYAYKRVFEKTFLVMQKRFLVPDFHSMIHFAMTYDSNFVSANALKNSGRR